MAAAHIDLLATPGHKSLLGPPGTGALILGGGVTLDAWRTGGTGGDSSYPLQPEEYPHHLEAGTLNTPGIAAMMEGVAYVEKRGLDAIRAHEMALLRRLVEGLGDHGKVTFYGPPPSAARVSVVCFNVLGSAPDEVARASTAPPAPTGSWAPTPPAPSASARGRSARRTTSIVSSRRCGGSRGRGEW
jgi:selenocysteine lyase/cysteine desulfurase